MRSYASLSLPPFMRGQASCTNLIQFNFHPFQFRFVSFAFHVGGAEPYVPPRPPRPHTCSPRGWSRNLRLTIVQGAWPHPVPPHLGGRDISRNPAHASRASGHFALARDGPLVFVKAPIQASATFGRPRVNEFVSYPRHCIRGKSCMAITARGNCCIRACFSSIEGVTTLGGSDSPMCCDWLRATNAPIMTQRCEFTTVRVVTRFLKLPLHSFSWST